MTEAATVLQLAERLAEAERTIDALLSGQIDTKTHSVDTAPVQLFKAEHQLRKSEELYRRERDRAQRFLDAAEVILLAADRPGTITLINRYGAELLGWTPDELIGKRWVETCIPERLRSHVRQRYVGVLSGDVSTGENCVLLRSGEERLIKWRNRVLTDEDGNVIGAFTCGTDITEEKRANDLLRAAEEKMRFALEAAGIGIWDIDPATRKVTWSSILEKQYGLEPGGFPGTTEGFLDLVHPDDRELVRATLREASTKGTDFSSTNRAVMPDGAVRWFSGSGRIQIDERGEALQGLGISMDITEQRTMELQSQQAQKMEAVGRLASGVAHDFNNLLTVIIGFADLLSSDAPSLSQQGKDLGEILKAAQRAAGLTKQLLAFSRQQVMTVSDLDINALITDMSGMFGRLIGEDVRVSLDLPSGLCHALGDRSQMEQVLMNLVVNARDAMPNGGELLIETDVIDLDHSTIDEETIVNGQYVKIAVTDTGTGMDKETERRLFEPFFTTKEIGKGTGLGLSTTYGIVKQSRGYIGVNSELGTGTTFTVYLPCSDSPPDDADQKAITAVELPVAFETILLVEDEAAVRELAKRILVNAGYSVIQASSGKEAEAQFARHRGAIDAIVTDVIMPGNSGPATVKRLRATAPDIKVLYMSGYAEQTTGRQVGFGTGAAFIQKPFTADELTAKLRETLDSPIK